MRTEGSPVPCSLDVLHGGLGINGSGNSLYFLQGDLNIASTVPSEIKKMPGLSTPSKEPIELIGWNWWDTPKWNLIG
jgi:hypothetical protein